MSNQLSLFEGVIRRDEGIAKVSKNNGAWLEECIKLVEQHATNWYHFTGEDIRHICEAAWLIPAHHNAWGALTSSLIKRGLIRKTGNYRQMRDPRSHARMTATYERV